MANINGTPEWQDYIRGIINKVTTGYSGINNILQDIANRLQYLKNSKMDKTNITDSVTTTSSTIAASAAAVEKAYDKGVSAYNLAGTKLGASSNAVSATKLKAITTTFTSKYPIAFNVFGTIYSNSDITYAGDTKTLKCDNIASPNLIGTPTAPTAAVGDNSTKIATTAFVANSTIGIGQTWQDMSSSRNNGVTYTNDTSKPIVVLIAPQYTATGQYSTVTIDDVDVASSDSSSNDPNRSTLSFIVPAGSTYKLTSVAGSILNWSELR